MRTQARTGVDLWKRRSGRVLAAVTAVALLAGCSSIGGTALADPELIPPPGKPVGYQASNFDITYADDSEADQFAKDALDDIVAYYSSFYQDLFGHEFTPPEHFFSIGPGDGNASGCMSDPDDDIVENNAFYRPKGDEITYWRPLLERFAEDYSDMQVGLVLAHEMGHAVQDREDMYNVRSIVAETQADCFAGTWARATADGKNPHFKFNPANMDTTLQIWSTELPSEVGSDPDADGQHGSAFDRVTAFQEGYESGPTACRDNFNDSRFFTSAEFTANNASEDGQGNAAFDDTVEFANTIYNAFYATAFEGLNAQWEEPKVLIGGSGESSCPTDLLLTYCAANNSVVISDEDALRRVHGNYGDFAVMTAIGLAYGTAAIVELQYSEDDPNAMKAASCLTGALAGDLLDPNNPYQLTLSPGDFDEATVMLLTAGPDNPVVDTGGVSAFDRMDAFRSGVNGGATSCGVSGG